MTCNFNTHNRPPKSRSPSRIKQKKKEKLIIVCKADYDTIIEPNSPIYLPGLRLKRDLGLDIIDVKDIKAVSFWAKNVMNPIIIRELIMWQYRI